MRPRARVGAVLIAAGFLFLLAGIGVYSVGAGQAVQVSPSYGPPGTNPVETAGFVLAVFGVFFLFVGFVLVVAG